MNVSITCLTLTHKAHKTVRHNPSVSTMCGKSYGSAEQQRRCLDISVCWVTVQCKHFNRCHRWNRHCSWEQHTLTTAVHESVCLDGLQQYFLQWSSAPQPQTITQSRTISQSSSVKWRLCWSSLRERRKGGGGRREGFSYPDLWRTSMRPQKTLALSIMLHLHPGL